MTALWLWYTLSGVALGLVLWIDGDETLDRRGYRRLLGTMLLWPLALLLVIIMGLHVFRRGFLEHRQE